MRILTVVENLQKGGTQRVAQTFAEAYAQLGHDSKVIVRSALGPRADELQSRNIEVWQGEDAADVRAAVAWNPDVIHIHTLLLEPRFVDSLIRGCNHAAVVETNVFSTVSPWEARLKASFQLSQWCLWLYRRRGGDMSKAVVVPNPVNDSGFFRSSPSEISEFRSRLGVTPRELLVLRIGQAYEGKWSPLAADAFDELVSSGVEAKLALVNPPKRLLEIVRKSPIRDRAIVIDQIIGDEALRHAYSAADVFLHVADQGESFGLVLAESMLCGTPVVTLSTPWEDNSQCEVVGNMQGGLVAASRAGFVNALRALSADPTLRQRLGEQGRERVMSRYRALTVAQRALDIARATGSPPSVTDRPPSGRAAIEALYADTFDRPGTLLTASVGRLERLHLSRYLSGYQPWSRLVSKVFHALGARFGVCDPLSRW